MMKATWKLAISGIWRGTEVLWLHVGKGLHEFRVEGIRRTGRADYAIEYGASGNMLETPFVTIGTKSGARLVMEKAVSQTISCLGEPLICSNIAYRYFEK